VPVTTLPKHWEVYADGNIIRYFKLLHNTASRVVSSVVIYENHSWDVIIHEKKIGHSVAAIARFPQKISSSDAILDLISVVENSTTCPGNPEEKFVDECRRKGGSIKGDRGLGQMIGFIDNSGDIKVGSETYSCTVRSTNCDIMCMKGGRCSSCSNLRGTLRTAICRQQKAKSDRTAADSHVAYTSLSSKEKDDRLKNLHCALKVARRQNHNLKAKLTKLIEEQSVSLQSEDVMDISTVTSDVQPLVESNFPPQSPQRIFWEQQLLYNGLKDKRQMRWHPLVIRFALNLKYLSSSAYKAMRQSSIIHLPSERTLSDYTHWASPHSGVQKEYIEEFVRMMEATSCGQNHCSLSMDEMKIRSGLVFNKHNGTLIGFVDLGKVNHEIELLVSGKNVSKQELADQVFVFMARAVFKPSLSVPVAHYFSLSLKGSTWYR